MGTSTVRLSKKQREFLELVEMNNRPVEIDGQPAVIPYYIKYDFYWDWGFNYERNAQRWLDNLVERGLVTIKDRTFAKITDAGRAAIGVTEKGGAA